MCFSCSRSRLLSRSHGRKGETWANGSGPISGSSSLLGGLCASGARTWWPPAAHSPCVMPAGQSCSTLQQALADADVEAAYSVGACTAACDRDYMTMRAFGWCPALPANWKPELRGSTQVISGLLNATSEHANLLLSMVELCTFFFIFEITADPALNPKPPNFMNEGISSTRHPEHEGSL